MKGVLHYDLQQDYDVISPGRPHSFNLKVRRALDTGDAFDVVLEKVRIYAFLHLYTTWHMLCIFHICRSMCHLHSLTITPEIIRSITSFMCFKKRWIQSKI